MNADLVIGLAGGISLGILFVHLVRRLLMPSRATVATPEWISSYSPRRYRPMERLLRRDDYLFLSSQPGCDQQLLRRFRASRSIVFRRYLRSLVLDFNRLHLTVRLLLLTSKVDRPDLARELLLLRVSFSYAILAAHCKLSLHALGLGVPRVEIEPLVGALEKLCGQLQLMAAPAVRADFS